MSNLEHLHIQILKCSTFCIYINFRDLNSGIYQFEVSKFLHTNSDIENSEVPKLKHGLQSVQDNPEWLWLKFEAL